MVYVAVRLINGFTPMRVYRFGGVVAAAAAGTALSAVTAAPVLKASRRVIFAP
jgi:hypothetical protein